VRVKTEAKSGRGQLSHHIHLVPSNDWPLADRDRRAASFDFTRASSRSRRCQLLRSLSPNAPVGECNLELTCFSLFNHAIHALLQAQQALEIATAPGGCKCLAADAQSCATAVESSAHNASDHIHAAGVSSASDITRDPSNLLDCHHSIMVRVSQKEPVEPVRFEP
jgi:hypothetical protein